ncbi:DUF433 domain-containing protein [Corynebacterium pygosceleis]|uniref:DUF433 domain-containing protein n=1 Tax=Corynebacterium pygosceleis TaxID=2800406 RepID=UPI001903F141|nr:DUF433 domain-containing protein [Corynebacterium pygosceleis]MCL0120141.1 DUF433 domain-containing protein [Corynebacterium pygosceleis]
MTQFLTGATESQLNRWAREGILVPEIQQSRPKLYSFRDLVALRMIARLRSTVSLQKIRLALQTLEDYDLTDHLSEYRFATDSKSVKLWTENGFMDVVNNPGQWELFNLEKIYESFVNFRKRTVPHLLEPSNGIKISPDRLGGRPTIRDLRVPFDTVIGWSEEVTTDEDLKEYYPFLTMRDVLNAESFKHDLEEAV